MQVNQVLQYVLPVNNVSTKKVSTQQYQTHVDLVKSDHSDAGTNRAQTAPATEAVCRVSFFEVQVLSDTDNAVYNVVAESCIRIDFENS